MLSFAAKWHGTKRIFFEDERSDMLTPLWDLLDQADAVVHYNGKSFDIPHINREFLLAGMGPPSPYAQIDLYHTVRSQFRFLSNKLDSVSEALALGRKDSHEGFDLWVACLAGDEKAWARMKRYNIQDVRLTDKLYERLLPWIKAHPNVSLIDGKVLHSCPKCGGPNLQRRGFAYTKVSVFQQWQCQDCGSYSRSGKRERGAEAR
jgi:DNA polymerase elongation subunit (family B)